MINLISNPTKFIETATSEIYRKVVDIISTTKIHESSDNELPSWLVKQLEKRAKDEMDAGGEIEINYRLPYVSVKMSDDSEYFFQGHEADELLDDVPDNISPEDYILATAQDW